MLVDSPLSRKQSSDDVSNVVKIRVMKRRLILLIFRVKLSVLLFTTSTVTSEVLSSLLVCGFFLLYLKQYVESDITDEPMSVSPVRSVMQI